MSLDESSADCLLLEGVASAGHWHTRSMDGLEAGSRPVLARSAQAVLGDDEGNALEGEDEAGEQEITSCRRGLLAIFVTLTSLLAACLVADIVVIWTYMGSSVCVIIGYVIPTVSYLKLRAGKSWGWREPAAALLLALSMAIMGGGTTRLSCTRATSSRNGASE